MFPPTDKNHNPRKGTETAMASHAFVLELRIDKNHNPRKGTETVWPYRVSIPFGLIRTIIPARGRKHQPGRTAELLPVYEDKNHNPRKGTGKKKAAQSSQFPLLGEC